MIKEVSEFNVESSPRIQEDIEVDNTSEVESENS
jgi:hypothetical protein